LTEVKWGARVGSSTLGEVAGRKHEDGESSAMRNVLVWAYFGGLELEQRSVCGRRGVGTACWQEARG